MKKLLWVLNKYIIDNIYEKHYIEFLINLQLIIKSRYGIELHYILFNDNLYQSLNNTQTHFFKEKIEDKEFVQNRGILLEKKYGFTFKQACFADIIQTTSLHRNLRNIDVNNKYFTDFTIYIQHFEFLESIILNNKIDYIFSDVSPEAEMEFGRIIGLYYNKLVIKDYEGSFLGRSVFLKLNKFGSDDLIKANIGKHLTAKDSYDFINNYIHSKLPPYTYPIKTIDKKLVKNKIQILFSLKFSKIFKYIFKLFQECIYFIEEKILKQLYYDKFEKNQNYFFFGLHLNQESTIVLRAQPYTNQTVLVEMISRVMPINHFLYVREHPHWRKTFSLKYLKMFKKFNNVRLISPKVSIHEIIKYSNGILTYNATTGIEALIYGKPVLSFASNIYYNQHSSVYFCNNLYLLGEYLIKLLNNKFDEDETIQYIQDMHKYSYDFWLGSYFFTSKDDANLKAEKFAFFLTEAILTCKND